MNVYHSFAQSCKLFITVYASQSVLKHNKREKMLNSYENILLAIAYYVSINFVRLYTRKFKTIFYRKYIFEYLNDSLNFVIVSAI